MAEVRATYANQAHRRFIKTHTPVDGLPLRDDVTYIVVGRDPRDVSISMERHMVNMDMDRFLELRAHAVGSDDLAELPPRTPPSGDPRERFRTFVEVDTLGGPTTLASLLHHLSTAWERRKAPNVALFHYADYQVDLPGEMVRLAAALGMEFAESRIVVLAAEASLERMRARADEIVPSASLGIWRNTTAFLRAGASGQWQERVTEDDIARYEQRVASLVPPDLAAWAHLGRIGSGVEPT
jgi:Sulfotransferase domain